MEQNAIPSVIISCIKKAWDSIYTASLYSPVSRPSNCKVKENNKNLHKSFYFTLFTFMRKLSPIKKDDSFQASRRKRLLHQLRCKLCRLWTNSDFYFYYGLHEKFQFLLCSKTFCTWLWKVWRFLQDYLPQRKDLANGVSKFLQEGSWNSNAIIKWSSFSKKACR